MQVIAVVGTPCYHSQESDDQNVFGNAFNLTRLAKPPKMNRLEILVNNPLILHWKTVCGCTCINFGESKLSSEVKLIDSCSMRLES